MHSCSRTTLGGAYRPRAAQWRVVRRRRSGKARQARLSDPLFTHDSCKSGARAIGDRGHCGCGGRRHLRAAGGRRPEEAAPGRERMNTLSTASVPVAESMNGLKEPTINERPTLAVTLRACPRNRGSSCRRHRTTPWVRPRRCLDHLLPAARYVRCAGRASGRTTSRRCARRTSSPARA
jgi:hypothetical protein